MSLAKPIDENTATLNEKQATATARRSATRKRPASGEDKKKEVEVKSSSKRKRSTSATTSREATREKRRKEEEEKKEKRRKQEKERKEKKRKEEEEKKKEEETFNVDKKCGPAELPAEMLADIFKWLPPATLAKARQVCRRWTIVERALRRRMQRKHLPSARAQFFNSEWRVSSPDRGPAPSMDTFITSFHLNQLIVMVNAQSTAESLFSIAWADLQCREVVVCVHVPPSPSVLSVFLADFASNRSVTRLSICLNSRCGCAAYAAALIPSVRHRLKMLNLTAEGLPIDVLLDELLVDGEDQARPSVVRFDECVVGQDKVAQVIEAWRSLESPPSLHIVFLDCPGASLPRGSEEFESENGSATLKIEVL